MVLALVLLPKLFCLALFGMGALFVLFFEYIRTQDSPLGHFALKIFGALLRPKEKTGGFKPSGAVYVLLSAFIITLIAPAEIAALALIIALTGDTAAALIGRRFGKNRFYGKSCEGTLAFIVVGSSAGYLGGLWLGLHTSYLPDYLECAVIAAAIVAALAEVFSPKIFLDDNLTVPIAATLTLMLLY
jgi:dolichol kinase